jgi:hypothetical protein
MIRLARTFVTAGGVVCSSIHCAQKLAYSLNASLRPLDIKKDFAVSEYSPEVLRQNGVKVWSDI